MRLGKFDSEEKLIKSGFKTSWYIFLFSFIFIFFWVIGFSCQDTFISNSDFFSKAFFFLNPNIFRRLFIHGYFFSDLRGAISQLSFIFLFSYVSCFLIFAVIVSCCAWLFFVSFKTNIRGFHYISCLGLFPIIGFFLIFVFIVRMGFFQFEKKFKKYSRYERFFEPEIFDDLVEKEFTEEDLMRRPITSEFTIKHYEHFFSPKKKDILSMMYEKLKSLLS